VTGKSHPKSRKEPGQWPPAHRTPRRSQSTKPARSVAPTARQTIIAGLGGFATGRFTTPEEVAALITFLASDRAGNITGVNYLIEGGLIKTT
jgi:NAD(P)-dependent dehydrogenase (short-subunit alcohol dehydrogenase family)